MDKRKRVASWTGSRDDASPRSELTDCIEQALSSKDLDHVPQRIQSKLAELLQTKGMPMDERFHRTKPESYARRLLYSDPGCRYTIVVMTWGAGQATPVHDHAGIWCVEGVVEGEIEVTQYELEHAQGDVFHFEPQSVVRAGVGSTGSLIPPHEYHRLRNATDKLAITVHVYGGEILECNAYLLRPEGTYQRELRTLSYDD